MLVKYINSGLIILDHFIWLKIPEKKNIYVIFPGVITMQPELNKYKTNINGTDFVLYSLNSKFPAKLLKCWFNVGPPSVMLSEH